jgi:hypothetical protein
LLVKLVPTNHGKLIVICLRRTEMKKNVLLLFIFLTATFLYAGNGKQTLVIYYFGATNCGWCNTEECINSIKKMHQEFSNIHNEFNVKFVMVCMDTDINEGLKFISKYGYGDEISIGSHFHNELVMNYLDKTKIPGTPHIIVFRDLYENDSAPLIKKRKTIIDLVGVNKIKEWVENKYPLE